MSSVSIPSGQGTTAFSFRERQDEERRARSLPDLFSAQVARWPHRIAVVFEGQRLTYRELDERSNRLANHLRGLGVQRETLVALCLERSIDVIVSILAILKAGGAYLPLDPAHGKERLAFYFEDSRAPIVITTRALGLRWPEWTRSVLLDEDALALAAEPATTPVSVSSPEDLAYVIYTSGSTGTPKGVMVTHGNVMWLFRAMERSFDFDEHDVWSLFHSYAFDFSVWEMWGALLYGGRVVVVSGAQSRALHRFARLIREEGVTILSQTPSAFRQLAPTLLAAPGGTSLRYVIFGGESLDFAALRPWVERFGDACPVLVNMYGITETTVFCTHRRTFLDDILNDRRSLIGAPLAELDLLLLDEALEPVSTGQVGEIFIAGECLARGYLGRPGLTAKRYPICPRDGRRLYRSGDLARRLPDGDLEYLGRADDQVKIRGFRIELGEIIARLLEHPEVEDAAVISVGQGGEQRLVAYVVPKAPGFPDARDLQRTLSRHLPEYMIPQAIVFIERLPLTVNGKLDRAALPPPRIERASFRAPETSVERQLARFFADALHVPVVGLDDGFLALGGDSLRANQILWGIEKELGVELPPKALFETRSLAELAALIDGNESTPQRETSIPRELLPRDQPLPLSHAQEQIWLHQRFAAQEPIYNETMSIHARSALDEAALRSALRRVIRRHEVLRATFVEVDGKPEKRVRPDGDVAWLSVDLRAKPAKEREIEARKIARAVARPPFDLATGPLLRVTLIRFGDEDTRLFMTFHHIVMDGMGMTVFFSDLEQEYLSVLAGQPPLPPPSLQEADHCAHQREALLAAQARHLSYWQKQLEGLPELELPTDRPRTAIQSFRGGSVQRALPRDLVLRVRAAATNAGFTPYQIYLAAFVALLQRHTQQDEVVLGGLTSGRAGPDENAILGCFLSNLVLRVPFTGLRSFRDLVTRVRDIAADAYAHAELPFHELVAALHPTREPSKNPLFQVMFASEPPHPKSASGWELRYIAEIDKGASRLDLVCELMEVGDELWLMTEYSTDLFDAVTVERMVERYFVLLSGAIDELMVPAGDAATTLLSALPVLAPGEREQLARFAGSDAPYPDKVCFHHLVEAQARERPEALAADFGTEVLSYGQLDARANQLAHLLCSLGVGPEIRVGICVERSLDLLVAIFGVLKAGGAYVPLDPAYPRARLSFMLEDAGISVLLSEQGARGALPATSARIVLLDEERSTLTALPDTPPAVHIGPDNLAYVIYTSGSTGRPKGVLVPHRGVCSLAPWLIRMFDIHPASRVLQFTSPSFDVSVMEIAMTLTAGATLVLAPRNDILPGLPLLRLLREKHVTVASLPPSALAALDFDDSDPGSLPVQTIIAAGEALPAKLVARFAPGRRFFNLYGPTETTIGATIGECLANEAKPSIGRPVQNTRCFVLDAQMQPTPIGVPGELYIGCVGVTRGYHHRAGLTAERFVPNPFGEGRLYRTGDRVRWLEDGSLDFLGRLDAQVKLRGFRIELGEIEAQLGQHPEVREAAAMVVSTATSDRVLVAYVVPRSDAPRDLAAVLKHYLRERVPDPMVPSAIVTLDRLPVGPNGKLDRAALPAPLPPTQSVAAATTAFERAVTSIWQEILGLSSIGVDDPFFEVGGHSLALARVQVLLRARLGVEVDIVALLGLPTIRKLAAHIAALSTARLVVADREHAAHAEPSAQTEARKEAIAIVGMAIRAPGIRDLHALWDVVYAGRETIRALDPETLIAAGADPARVRRPEFVAREGVLDDADRFDAAFFGYSDADAALMDPQQRLFLACAHEALEHAGCDPSRFQGRIGVFGGAGAPRYWMGPVADRLRREGSDLEGYRAMTLNAPDFLATRVAFKLGLRGPALTVQTACSTSLTAIHLARQSLLAGECEMALAGGVSLASLSEAEQGYLHAEGGILSPDGHCRPFDARARGTVKSSGVALVVLKRLSSALADGDTIHGVIAGSALNNDGAGTKVGFTAPSEEGLADAIERAYASASIDPSTVAFVEAHGTGTQLGDPTEVRALMRVYGQKSLRRGVCALGSLKANLGHLDTAAGAAGLIKATLALTHEIIPPLAGFQKPNPLLGLPETPFYVNDSPRPWPRTGSPRRAGVNAMGVGGTNVHVVLEEAPLLTASLSRRPFQLLCISARTPTALTELARKLHEAIEEPSSDVADFAYTLALGRTERRHRMSIVCRDRNEAQRALAEEATQTRAPTIANARPVVFLFPGHGVHYPRMARDLYEAEPVYRTELDRCIDILRDKAGLDLRPFLVGEASDDDPRLDQMACAQPLLFAVEYALGRQLMAWGVRPSALLGHSVGEYVAACLAGVFSLEDALTLVIARGRLMDSTPPGGMLTVFCDETTLAPYLGAGVSIATYAPGCVVLSGPVREIEALRARLERAAIETTGVRVPRASHSPLMNAIREDFRCHVAEIALRAPEIPIVSNVTGAYLSAEQAQNPDYWADHLTHAVHLTEGIGTLLDLNAAVFLELGPGHTLGSFLKRHPRRADDANDIVATLPGYKKREQPSHAALLRGLGKLWELGVEVDWSAFYTHEKRRRIPLPPHPLEGQRYTLERRPTPPTQDLDARSLELARERNVRNVDDHAGLRARLEEVCASLVLDFFSRRLGDAAFRPHEVESLRQLAGILPAFAPMTEYLTQLLARTGFASKTPDAQILLSAARAGRSTELAARLRNDYPSFAGLLRFIEHCVSHYDEALTGAIEPVGVLYPDATDAFYVACMRDTEPYQHDEVYLATARDAVMEFIERRKGQKTRILEIGAGHGRLSWRLLERLRGADVEYHFTDIGRSFLHRAEAEAKRRGLSFLRCFRFDLNTPSETQGIEGNYDLILGFNAVHVAIDLTRALRNLHDLLTPGGRAIFVELTRTEPWDYLCWGLAPGFWDIERARVGSLGMPLARWEETLKTTGFTRVRGVPRDTARRASEDHCMLIAERGCDAVRPQQPASDSLEELLLGMWKRMLGVSQVPPGASFFDLGGDSLLAVQLLSEVSLKTGHTIKKATFVANPTIAGLAAILRATEAPAPKSEPIQATAPNAEHAEACLLPLRAQGSKRPFFCVHPIGGGALCYAPLSAAMDADRPFYGLQTPMLEDPSARPGSIEEMATLYVDAIRRIQAGGPYLLGGWSFGGVVAAEMAQRLHALGEEVGALILLDVNASPPPRLELLRKLDERLPSLAMLPAIFAEIGVITTAEDRRRGSSVERLSTKLGIASRHLVVYDHHLTLWRRYHSPEQQISTTHFTTSTRSGLGYFMRPFRLEELPIRGMKTVPVAGDHFSMLSGDNLKLLARQIDAVLQARDPRAQR